jgi:hypothetical protein
MTSKANLVNGKSPTSEPLIAATDCLAKAQNATLLYAKESETLPETCCVF